MCPTTRTAAVQAEVQREACSRRLQFVGHVCHGPVCKGRLQFVFVWVSELATIEPYTQIPDSWRLCQVVVLHMWLQTVLSLYSPFPVGREDQNRKKRGKGTPRGVLLTF